MARIIRIALLTGVMIAASQTTYAEETETQNVSTISRKSFLDLLSEKTTLVYSGTFRGGPLMDLRNSCQPSVDGNIDRTNPLSVESQVTAGYKLSKDLMVGAVGHFMYFPVGKPVGTGQNVQLLDPSLTISKSDLIRWEGFRLKGSLLAELPAVADDFLQRNHLATALSSVVNMTYTLPNSPLTVGVFGYLRGYVPTSEASPTCRTYKVYVAPNFNYQLTESFAATLWIDLIQANRYAGSHFITGLENATVDIEPGINFDITKNVSFNPILNIYPAHPTLSSTSIQANIVAKAF
jgi:hypothetical protein